MRPLSVSRRVASLLTARVAFSNVPPATVSQPRRNVSQPAYDGHIPLNWAENAFLAVGSAVMSLMDPRRGGVPFDIYVAIFLSHHLSSDMIAALGETTGAPALPRLREQMLDSIEGRRILRERPRVNSETVDMEKLSQLPHGTFGRAYMTWLDRCGVTPDTREPVFLFNIPSD
jgi:ubiquinone biosynthesis protein COQ4